MAEASYPTAGGGSVTDTTYEKLMGGQTGDGLVGNPTLPSLVYADSSGRQVKIRPERYAIVRGFMYYSGTSVITLPIGANTSGKTRIDRVVLRLDRTNHTVRAAVKGGSPATTPSPPALVQQDSPARYWELPLATVSVANRATGLVPSAVTNTSYHLAEPPLVGHAAGRPAVSPGRIYRDIDHDRVYVGSENNTWQTMYYDTGWVNLKPPSGFALNGGFRCRIKNGWVNLVVALKYTNVTAISKKRAVTLKTLTAGYRPSADIFAPVVITSPDHSTYIQVKRSGAVVLQADYSHTVAHNASIFANISYPINT